ncbi:alpha/beta hydrolase [Methylobacterium frigidaeris]|uniref:Uncharacterized protein n=1 Tax=Methylobacterium frigidaeris TaxID=2038277 RepID=A0AA37HHT6_9HYPH|nr:alpha/beta hydrolase [Methylobacterium frigidaeris]PIK74107.1 hypothetical protein CS379_04340 [Methylobacterium frigidaeris]GJD66013.1 hypothetical protein MPEAHAMD_6209 [Methylobacterium frigidaeris]
MSPIVGKTADHDGRDKAFLDALKAGIVKARAQFLDDFSPVFNGIHTGTSVSPGVFRQTLQLALVASIKATVDCATALAETGLRSDRAKIDVPTPVAHGDADQVAPCESAAKLVAEMIRDATLKVYPGAPKAGRQILAGIMIVGHGSPGRPVRRARPGEDRAADGLKSCRFSRCSGVRASRRDAAPRVRTRDTTVAEGCT